MIKKGRNRPVSTEPPATTTGKTGTMQGETPVMNPPRNAIASSSATNEIPYREEALRTRRRVICRSMKFAKTSGFTSPVEGSVEVNCFGLSSAQQNIDPRSTE